MKVSKDLILEKCQECYKMSDKIMVLVRRYYSEFGDDYTKLDDIANEVLDITKKSIPLAMELHHMAFLYIKANLLPDYDLKELNTVQTTVNAAITSITAASSYVMVIARPPNIAKDLLKLPPPSKNMN